MVKPILANSLRGLSHGFFTREGGVSTGLYESLNGGQGSADTSDAVDENRRRIRDHLGAESLISVNQVHSPKVVVATGAWEQKPDADAMVTTTPGVAIAVLAADCGPVIFADREAGVIGAAHAGWKGALTGVLEATVGAMRDLGARNISAVLGPCISQANYEVGPEFLDRFMDEDPDYQRFFAGGKGNRMQFDLPGFVLSRLREAGAEAEWTGHCTYADPARFYSYRRSCHRNEPDYGRLVAAISL
ncbi:peptidoglycan editing factor PgeF [Rhodobacteraceae bacterium NNCM2]|nr:peptidoglycan editing factor PgeF [Coraliihabitans acroporae]